MRWPWAKETRANEGFSDLVVSGLLARAEGAVRADALAAAEAATGFVSRSISLATVEGPSGFTEGLTPACLAMVARQLMARGESLHLIQVRSGRVVLTPASSWDVYGRGGPLSYRLDLAYPDGQMTTRASADRVLHVRVNSSPERPWEGRAPLALAHSTGELARRIEQSLDYEARTPTGKILAQPDGAAAQTVERLRQDLERLHGAVSMPATTAAGYGGGAISAPRTDWVPRRLGPEPTAEQVELRAQLQASVWAAFGLNPGLFDVRGDGTGKRESLRQAYHSVLLPVLNLIEAEVRDKVHEGIGLRLSRVGAADVAGRSRSLSQLVKAGVPLAEARRLVGLD